MSEDDKYTYPGSGGVLVNHPGIRDARLLDEALNDYATVPGRTICAGSMRGCSRRGSPTGGES
ncbi:MAG TPA: hypothetical protein VJQ61_06120 [Sinomonas sp.]|nr:hypothetical protein [Sinomonas sp.]